MGLERGVHAHEPGCEATWFEGFRATGDSRMKHDLRHVARVLLVVSTALAAGTGCSERNAAEQGSASSVDAPVERAPRFRIHRRLLGESARAELDVGGLFIDFGTGEQQKYTCGGWHTGWGSERVDVDGTRFASIHGTRAVVTALPRDPVREIVLRARSAVNGQRVQVRAGGADLGTVDVGPTWSILRLPADGLRGGERLVLELDLDGADPDGASAEVDWLWLRSAESEEPPMVEKRVEPLQLGGRTKLALPASSSRSYSFYLEPPPRASLVFWFGATEAVEFAVRAQTSDGDLHELFAAKTDGEKWSRAQIDLRPFTGRVIRLELASRGEAELAGWATPTIVLPPAAIPPRAAARSLRRPRNVVFVVMDTTRADAFASVDPNTNVVTPVFDALAAESTTFANAYNNENWTVPSTATILSGVYPRSHRAQKWKQVVPEELELLPEHLQRHGMRTVGISANVFVSKEFGFDQGWDRFENVAESNRDTAKDVFDDAIRWLEEHGSERPFFFYVQSMDAHTPYRVARQYSKLYHPKPYDGVLGPYFSGDELAGIRSGEIRATSADRAWIRALYDGEITYQDEQLGRLLDSLEESGLADDTLVVITNDHGEELGDHGGMGHTRSMHEEILRAPLLIHYPPLFPAGKRVEAVVEHVDLAPTIVEALGLPPMSRAEGISVVPLVTGEGGRRRPLYATMDFRDQKRVVRVGRWKLTLDAKAGWKSLYDLDDDPGETRDRKTDRAIAARAAEIYLAEALASPDKQARMRRTAPEEDYELEEAEIDDDTRAQVESLGYVEDDGS